MPGFRRKVDFIPSKIRLRDPLTRLRFGCWHNARRPMPHYSEVKPCFANKRWSLLFLYLPDGRVSEAQRFILNSVRELNRCLLIVCAAPTLADVPREVIDISDALYWKALGGYDFSAYSIGLHALARQSPKADVFVMNDSVFGPFPELPRLLESSDWDLMGFTGSLIYENHFQSYAFFIKDVTLARLKHLKSIFSLTHSYDDMTAIILLLETRFARIASKRMTVGVLWYGPDGDTAVDHALPLIDEGMPFVKRSLLGKFSHRQNIDLVRARLVALGVPERALR
jgi:hypothetical protein